MLKKGTAFVGRRDEGMKPEDECHTFFYISMVTHESETKCPEGASLLENDHVFTWTYPQTCRTSAESTLVDSIVMWLQVPALELRQLEAQIKY
jgi:hypothetical protein